ncbi:MAG: OmpH family outer membrane protein [Spirosomaceae bacterium]|jgi:outer membrane protein|nr:OmpH family outer membrane protein [Spirosomataceae bacterium]
MKSKLMVAALVIAALIGFEANAQSQLKIGWTNVDYVLGALPDSKKISNEMQIQSQQVQKALQEKYQDYQQKVDAFQKNQATWSEIIRNDKAKQIQTLEQDIQEFQRTSQETLEKKQQQLLQPVLGKINAAIEAVGKENGYTYILNMDAGANTTPIILFAGSEELNVSNLVLKKLGVDPVELEKQQKAAAEQAVQQLQNQQKPAATPATQQPANNKPATTPAPTKKN